MANVRGHLEVKEKQGAEQRYLRRWLEVRRERTEDLEARMLGGTKGGTLKQKEGICKQEQRTDQENAKISEGRGSMHVNRARCKRQE